MLRYAMQTLSQDRNTWVYIHGGSRGLDTAVFAPILKQVGVQYGRGIAVNISGYDSTAGEMEFGEQMLRDLAKNGVPGKRYVIDTSRNGMGRGKGAEAAHGACNQLGRSLGKRPTTSTGAKNVDAWLWIKPPGESDGACFRGDPHSGWFQSYAIDLTERALERGIITPKPLP
jgi:endoglucanase